MTADLDKLDALAADIERYMPTARAVEHLNVLRDLVAAARRGEEPDFWHGVLMDDPLLPDCSGTHMIGYGLCQRLAAALHHKDENTITNGNERRCRTCNRISHNRKAVAS